MPYFLGKIKVNKLKCSLLQFLFGALRVDCFDETYMCSHLVGRDMDQSPEGPPTVYITSS